MVQPILSRIFSSFFFFQQKKPLIFFTNQKVVFSYLVYNLHAFTLFCFHFLGAIACQAFKAIEICKTIHFQSISTFSKIILDFLITKDHPSPTSIYLWIKKKKKRNRSYAFSVAIFLIKKKCSQGLKLLLFYYMHTVAMT